MFHTLSEKCPKTGKFYNKGEKKSRKRIEEKMLKELLKRKLELLNRKEILLKEWEEKLSCMKS